VEDSQQATMEAVRSALLTQTAQAGEAEPAEESAATAAPASAAIATSTPVVIAATATPGSVEYTVQAGDWIFKIANQFGVDPQAIIDLNELTSPSQIEVGMVLMIPSGSAPAPAPAATGTAVEGGTVHVVKPGEWIWQIARLYNADPQAIIDANNLTNPGLIYPGLELTIP
jgi:LysM repeat protein